MSPGWPVRAMAAATCPAWVRLVVMLVTEPASPATTASVRMMLRIRRSWKVIRPTETMRMSGMNTTEA